MKTQSASHTIETIRLHGQQRYEDVYRLQVERRTAVEEGRAESALFLLEHSPVVTLGRNFEQKNLLKPEAELRAMGIDVCRVDRGGDATYHGPGQLVAYPILHLHHWSLTIKEYLRLLESVLIDQLAGYGLHAERIEGLTGVWVKGAKVAAIGIGIHKWVTFHGIALNVDPDMSHFKHIIPCGIADKPVTSLRLLLASPPPLSKVYDDFERHFRRYFA